MKIYKPNPKTGKMEVFESDQNDPRYHVSPNRQNEPLGKPFPQSDFKRPNQTYMMGDTPANPIIPQRNRTYDFTESAEPIIPQRNRMYSGGEVVNRPIEGNPQNVYTAPQPPQSIVNTQNTFDPYNSPTIIDDGFQLDPVEAVLNEAVSIFDDEGSGYDNLSFGDAFNKARENGENLFEWKGRVYNTQYKEEKVIEKEVELNDLERVKLEWHDYSKEEKAKWNNNFEKWYEFISHKAGEDIISNEKVKVKNKPIPSGSTYGGSSVGKIK